MINGSEVLNEKYPEFDDDSRTPNGLDLRLGKVYTLGNENQIYGLLEEKKIIPKHIEKDLENISIYDENTIGWMLLPNVPYILEVENEIKISSDSMQTYYPRSSLLRAGCTLHTAVGDAGYNGKLAFLFINHGPGPFFFEKGVRFAQLVDAQLFGNKEEYNGDYQNDKHKE